MDSRSEHLLEKIYLKKTELFSPENDDHFQVKENDGEEFQSEDKSLARLLDLGYVVKQDSEIIITEKGEEVARSLTRRYRLAERLLYDLLQVENHNLSLSACALEHTISPAITDSICTLLGHPPVCPHNKPIPPGECCRGLIQDIKPIVVSLDEARIGDTGKIAFIGSRRVGRIDKLSAMGLAPGCQVKLIQKKPSPVVRIGETEIAVESEIAKEIFIKY